MQETRVLVENLNPLGSHRRCSNVYSVMKHSTLSILTLLEKANKQIREMQETLDEQAAEAHRTQKTLERLTDRVSELEGVLEGDGVITSGHPTVKEMISAWECISLPEDVREDYVGKR